MRILMFEDQRCADLAPKAFCEARGHDVVGVTGSPDEAIRLARSTQPEIALVLSPSEGSDEAFMLMQGLSRLGVASLVLNCDGEDGMPTAPSWDERQLAEALSRYAERFRRPGDGEEQE